MSYNITLPNITGQDPAVQVAEMKSYLFQMVQQLNWALNTIEKGTGTEDSALVVAPSLQMSDEETLATFNSIKSLIIKSADIVSAYQETMETSFNGKYVAQSEFGTFTEETAAKIEANSSAIEQNYQSLETIEGDVNVIGGTLREVNAHIKTGELFTDDQGFAVYGVEVGQRDVDEEGDEVFNQYARFTADRLSFFDNNGTEVAYISDDTLYITSATITGNLRLGGYVLETNNGLAYRWVGGII